MGEPAIRSATYEDLLRLPEHLVGEIIDGDLYASPRPGPRHASAGTVLGGELSVAFQRGSGGRSGPGGWWILFEPELHLGRDVLVPDIAGWRREKMPALPDEAYFTTPPDWVCEVVSPSTENLDRVRKKRIYASAAIDFMWIVNPIIRTIEILRREGSFWTEIDTFEGEQLVRAVPFDSIEIDLARLWETS